MSTPLFASLPHAPLRRVCARLPTKCHTMMIHCPSEVDLLSPQTRAENSAPSHLIFSDFIELEALVSCCTSLFSRGFLPFTTHTLTHTHTIIITPPPPPPLLPSPSLSVSTRLYPLQPCLPVRKVLQYWRLGYPPPGPRTRASHRRTPRLGLPTLATDHGNHRYFHQVHRRVPAVRGAREVSSSRNVTVCIVFVLSCFLSPTPATSPHIISG